ncbi:glycerol channel [Allomyces arbusculus]|nr:glycerol channel [Allomyces arbusculus]
MSNTNHQTNSNSNSNTTAVDLDEASPPLVLQTLYPSMPHAPWWQRAHVALREYLAEILGTFMLVAVGEGAVAQTVLSKGEQGNALSVRFGFAAGITLGVLLAGDISGGHLNPAVTIAMAVHRGFPWTKVPGYLIAQGIGAFLGAAIIFACYVRAIDHVDGGHRTVPSWTRPPNAYPMATAGIFATYPAQYMTTGTAFLVEMIGTMVFVLGVLAATEPRNGAMAGLNKAVTVGISIFAVGVALGGETAFAINPTRDFAPRIFLLMVGYGREVFSAFNDYWWVPMIAPPVGGVLAGIVMRVFCCWPKSAEQYGRADTHLFEDDLVEERGKQVAESRGKTRQALGTRSAAELDPQLRRREISAETAATYLN